MRHHVRAAAADILRHADGRIFDLILSGQSAQLHHRFDDLVHARRADRMSARLQAAHRADRQLAANADLTVEAEARAFTRFGKAARFQTRHRRDGEGIVHFKEVDIVRGQLRLRKRLLRR